MKKYLLFIFIMLMGCEKEENRSFNFMSDNVEKVIQDDEHQLSIIENELEEINENLKRELVQDIKTRGFGDFLAKAILIAGADAAGTIAAGSGMATMINVGLITPPGAIATGAAMVVCGAASSIGAAIGVRVIKFSNIRYAGFTKFYFNNIGMSYISDSFPIFDNVGIEQVVLGQYEDLNRMGVWHNNAVEKWLGIKKFDEYQFRNTPLEREWSYAFNDRSDYYMKAYELSKIATSTFSNENMVQNQYELLLESYKQNKMVSDAVFIALKKFLDVYSLCKNEEGIKKVVQQYIGYIISNKYQFTDSEFQAMLAGFSVASKSPYVWDGIMRRYGIGHSF